jgi:Short C-terminal domain
LIRRRRQARKAAKQPQQDAQQQQPQDAQQQQAAQPVSQQPPPPPEQVATPAQPTGLTDEGLEQLKQLGALHESGVLTDAEFEAEKKKILG